MQLSLGARPPASDPKAPAGAAARSAKPQWFGGLRRLFESPRSTPPAQDSESDALAVFPSEGTRRFERASMGEVGAAPARKPGRSPKLTRLMVGAIVVVALIAAGVFTIRRFPLPQVGTTTAEQSRPGKLTIDTRSVSAEVLVDGARRGVTPLTLSLAPGPHTVTVRTENDERIVPLTIVAGSDVSQYFEMKAASPVAQAGQVSVTTDPPGARVAVDGRPRGVSPLTVSDLTAEPHKITVTSDAGSAERTVSVAAGSTAAVMFSLSRASGPVGGWLSIAAPFELQAAENDEVIGSSDSSRIMLAAGHHNVTLTNTALGYQESHRVDVSPGRITTIRVEPPKASVNVNARPWAEVVLDGRSVGQTPIANLLVNIGTHDIVFRHPQLGERKQTVVVSVKGPNRIAADLTK